MPPEVSGVFAAPDGDPGAVEDSETDSARSTTRSGVDGDGSALSRSPCSAQVAALLEALPMAAILLDLDLRVAHINATAREILGSDGQAARFAPAPAGLRRLADGTVIETTQRAVVVDGSHVGYLVVAHDVTGRVELETLADLRTRSLAAVTHELRTPLTAITSLVDLVVTNDTGHDTDHTGDVLDAVRRNAGFLLRTVDDLLLMAKIESHSCRLESETLDAAELIKGVAPETVTFSALTGPAPVSGDPRWLSRMFVRLFAAATAKTHPGTGLSVHASLAGGRWTAVISGMAQEPETADVPAGLDFAIAATIATRHGGEVTGTRGPMLVSVSLPVVLPTGT